MSTNAIITSWGANISGREEIGLGVFLAAIQYFTDCKQKGEIDDMRVYVARDGDISATAGHLIIEGSAAQLAALVARDDYQSIILKAGHVVHGFRTSGFVTGEGITPRIAQLQTARKELGL